MRCRRHHQDAEEGSSSEKGSKISQALPDFMEDYLIKTLWWLLPIGVLLGCAERPRDPTENESSLSLVIVGQALIEHDPRSYLDNPLNTVAPLLREADAVFTNLEVAVAGQGCICEPTREDVYFHGAGPEVIDYLKDLGVSLLSLANNHSWDYGAAGVLSTIAEVNARGLTHSGTGADLIAALAPAYLYVGDLRLSLVSIACSRLRPRCSSRGGRSSSTPPICAT